MIALIMGVPWAFYLCGVVHALTMQTDHLRDKITISLIIHVYVLFIVVVVMVVMTTGRRDGLANDLYLAIYAMTFKWHLNDFIKPSQGSGAYAGRYVLR